MDRPIASIDVDRIVRETFIARVEHHASIASTNGRAATLAACDGQPLPLLIVADRQTAGRGRGGNRWWTGDGGLAFSLLLAGDSVDAASGRPPLISLAAAVAVVETVAPLVPQHQVGLHWPNDVFVDQRKLAGILIEALADGCHVVGVGLNTNNSLAGAPVELQGSIATLRDLCGHACDHSAVLIDLLQRFHDGLVRLAAEPSAVAARADVLCLQRGRQLTVRWNQREIAGRCRGIAPDGALLLQTPTGTEALYSGVVSGDAP